MKYKAYVIEDENRKRYTGYSGRFDKRLEDHNKGITITTKKGKNWKLIYSKEFESKTEAIKYEKYLKTGKGREFIKKYWEVV